MKNKQNSERGLNFTNRIVTTSYSSDVISDDKDNNQVAFWKKSLALIVVGIVLLLILISSVQFFPREYYRGESVTIKRASVEPTKNFDIKLDEYSLSYAAKIIDTSEAGNYESLIRALDLKTLSKSKHKEICVVVLNSGDQQNDNRVAFNISLYNTKNQLVHKITNTFSSGSWGKYAVWECGSEFIDLPIGLYRVEINLVGNIQHKSYRVVNLLI